MIKKKIKNKNNIITFPSKLTQIEKEIEGIIFAAAEPLDIETISNKVSKKTNIENTSVLVSGNTKPNDQNQIKDEILGNKVTSPIIGTAYLAPEPGGIKFAVVGKKVKKGDTIMIVEAMKTMNHVPSTFDGIVKEVCVSDGQPVEFGQTLIIIE